MDKKTLLIVGVLALLVVISIVQAVQLTSLSGSVNELGTTNTIGAPKTTTSSSSHEKSSVPTNIQDLPGMVGGC